MGIINTIKRWWEKLFPKNVQKAMGVEIAITSAMDIAQTLWSDMYKNTPPWNKKAICTNIPATISEEMARLVLTEFDIEITGGQTGEYISEQIKRELDNIDYWVESYCAKGGIAIKPYISPDNNGEASRVELDIIEAERFLPVEYNSKGEITSALFLEFKRIGDYVYTRCELNKYDSATRTNTITNKAFCSKKVVSGGNYLENYNSMFSESVPLSTVSEWSYLSESPVEIHNMDKPLFVYIKVPKKNTIDEESPLGVSIFSRAVELIQLADEMIDKINWEYQSKETAVFADVDLFQRRDGKPEIPEGKDRLFKMLFDESSTSNEHFLEVFSPEIRDTSYFKGLNKYLRMIEWNVGLAYGTISDPDMVEKTATEVLSSKQRSFNTVSRIQKAWGKGLSQVAESMRVLAELYELCPSGEIETNCAWGDSVLEDVDKDFSRRLQLASNGFLSPVQLIMWYFSCDEKTAREMMPEERSVDTDPFGLNNA